MSDTDPSPLLQLWGVGHAAAALAHGLLVVLALQLARTRTTEGRWLAGAAGLSALWAGVEAARAALMLPAIDGGPVAAEHKGGLLITTLAAPALSLLREAAWCALCLALQRSAQKIRSGWADRRLQGVALCTLIGVVAPLVLPQAARLHFLLSLGLTVATLVLVEQLLRNLHEDDRWTAKPLLLGLALGGSFDLYMDAQGLLFGATDPDSGVARGFVQALSVALLAVGAKRLSGKTRALRLSQSAALTSTALLLAGLFLLVVAGMGYYVRDYGGTWGRALQLVIVSGALAGLAVVALSGTARARLRVSVSKHFFRYRYDYRQEWLQFTGRLASVSDPSELGAQVVRSLAAMVESPGGGLWLRRQMPGTASAPSTDPGAGDYLQSARWSQAEVSEAEPSTGPLASFLAERGWVIDLDEYRAEPSAYPGLVVPGWLVRLKDAQWIVPMAVGASAPAPTSASTGEALLGFAVLNRSRTRIGLDWELRDLLRTAARQAAVFVAQVRATEALLEARKFEAFNRMSAFVVHDLKNIVTQLSLMTKNARRLKDNPEFQADMIETVTVSVEKMQRLLLQLREGERPPQPGVTGADIGAILRRLQKRATETGRDVELQLPARVLVARGDAERLERVLGHLVQNALEATAEPGRVWAHAHGDAGHVTVAVGDEGCGMSEAFLREQLFKPFVSTKTAGMGIGMHESRQVVQDLGGSLTVDSHLNRGTRVTVRLPALDTSGDGTPVPQT